MAWHLLEKMIEHSAVHSTLLGKWWIAFMFVFRIIVIASIGDTVYSDEQDEFTCNTKQPGCKQVCYNMFAPISHIRFWAFQILATGTPSVIFIIYTMHRLATIPKPPEGDDAKKEIGMQTAWRRAAQKKKISEKEKEARMIEGDRNRSSSKKSNKTNESRDSGVMSRRSTDVIEYRDYDRDSSTYPEQGEKICRENEEKRIKRRIVYLYVVNVFFRTCIEITFMLLQIYMYQWTVPEFYECIRYPCPKIVECYISRPMEKTIFLYFMLAVSGICIMLNFLELNFLGLKKLKRICCPPERDEFVPPSITEGTYPEILDEDYPIHDVPRKGKHRVIEREARHAPPGYYIPDVDPPAQKYRSPASGFPPIRVGAASFTTSETDVTSDDDTMSSNPSIYNR